MSGQKASDLKDWEPANDAQGIAKMILDEGGSEQMAFETTRDKKNPATTLSKEGVQELVDGFEGFLLGNLSAYWDKHGVGAQRVRLIVRVAMDHEGVPQPIDGKRRVAHNLNIPAEELPMPYYVID